MEKVRPGSDRNFYNGHFMMWVMMRIWISVLVDWGGDGEVGGFHVGGDSLTV